MDLRVVSINDLARACADSTDTAEWEEFLRRTSPLASLVVLRVARLWMNGRSTELVDDIVQEVYLKLCEQDRRILREFEPRGKDSFLGLLRIVTTSVANDFFRRQHSAKRGGQSVMTALEPEQAVSHATNDGEQGKLYKAVLFAQLELKLRDAPETISTRDRNLFWLYYRQGLTAEEIALLPAIRLTAKGVESAVRRVAIWLRGQIGSLRRAGCPSESNDSDLALAQEDSPHSR